MKQLIAILLIIFTTYGVITATEIILSDEETSKSNKILRSIKCLVCDGQAVSESETKHAKSIRSMVENMVKQNKTESEIYDFVRKKYGDEILFEPPVDAYTSLLWITPFVLILIGFVLVVISLKKTYLLNKAPNKK